MSPVYTWLAPPALGAFIGYLTNYVAIRMLFRPLKPWRVMGYRLPMTPGVIPSKRHDLAINIGDMVGRHLLTGSDLSHALAEDKFQKELSDLISSRVHTLLQRDLGPVSSLIPRRFRSYFEAGVKILRWRSHKHLTAYLAGDHFLAQLDQAVAEKFSTFLDRDLNEILPDEFIENFFEFLESATARFMESPEVAAWIEESLDHAMNTAIDSGRTPADLLPDEFKNRILDLIAEQTPALIAKLATLLREPATQEKIAEVLVKAINDFAASLGPMAALIGNFIKPEVIAEKIKNYLATKGDDLGKVLFDHDTQVKIATMLRDKAEKVLNTPWHDLLSNIKPTTIDQGRHWLAGLILSFLRDPITGRAVCTLLRKSLEAGQHKDVRTALTLLTGENGVKKAGEKLSSSLLATIRSRNFNRVLNALMADLIEGKLLTTPIGRLELFLPREVKKGIDGFLLEQVNDLLAREVPDLLNSLKIHEIVTRKVDSLDLLSLERLLLSIMEEQFKYINLFGALLGFVIGLLNLLFIA
ncbi:MAG: DUF445 family protein [Proteobacteria bacterium]|nr:DUF445 family protein [Pseudomonadota bacterium]MBU1688804.1 DUF445 family protein [Pseudomonadota bacterium]